MDVQPFIQRWSVLGFERNFFHGDGQNRSLSGKNSEGKIISGMSKELFMDKKLLRSLRVG